MVFKFMGGIVIFHNIFRRVLAVSLSFGLLLGCSGPSATDTPSANTTVPPGAANAKPESPGGGGVDGGGGKSIVCREPLGQILSAELLDLYEAKTNYGLNIQSSIDSMDDQIAKALSVVPFGARTLISAYVDKVKKNIKFTTPGTIIKPIDDSLDITYPKGCAAEQLAHYQSEQLVLISYDIWSKLDVTNRAALIMHEAIYAVNRLHGSVDSRQSRHVVGHLFSVDTAWIDPTEKIPADALYCSSQNGALYFRAYKNGSIWILDFQVVGFAQVPSKKTAKVFGADFDFNEAKSFPILKGEDKIGTGTKTYQFLSSDFQDQDSVVFEKIWEPLVDKSGQTLPGFQTPRYYLSWQSGTFPDLKQNKMMLNCSFEF